MTFEQKKEIAKRCLEEYEDKTEYIPSAYADYIENVDKYSKLMGEIVKLTVF